MSAAARTLPGCAACGAALPEEAVSAVRMAACLACGKEQRWEVFPAFHAPPPAARGAEAVALPDEEAACAFHERKRAASACQRCGLFICALCEMPVGEETICPSCLESGVKKGKLKSLESHRFLWDRLALMLVTYPLLLFYFTLLTAPLALFLAIRYRNAPRSLVRPGRAVLVTAIVLAVVEIAGWGVLVVAVLAMLAGKTA